MTDATGLASSAVTPTAAGTIGLLAADGAVTQTASFTAVMRPDGMSLVSAPANGAWVGAVAGNAFSVRVMKADGVTPEVGLAVSLSGQGGVVLGACGAALCAVATDATGMASSAVTPTAAGTLNLTAVAGNLSESASFTTVVRPDVMTVVSVPANGAWVGSATAVSFSVRVFAGDGVTPVAGRSVVLSVSGGSGTLGACGSGSCTVLTDSTGLASSAVTPSAAGTIGLLAADGAVTQSASFTAAVRPDGMTVVSAPGNGAWVGSAAAVNFSVRVLLGDGVTPAAGRLVTVSVTNGFAMLGACGGASNCVLQADYGGLVTTAVTPTAAGTIGLLAADGAVMQAASFTAVNRPDVMTVVSVPGNGAWVGEVAANAFAVRVMKADGVTPEVGLAVTLSGQGGVLLGACGAASCAVVTDATGLATSVVTPTAAGVLNLTAMAGSLSASASFTASVRPDVLTLLSAPADGALVGDVAAIPFAVEVTLGGAGSTGQAVAGRSVTISVTNGNAVLAACGAARCVLTTDVSGVVQTGVLPKAAGTVVLLAVDGAVSQTATFVATAKPDVLQVASVPVGTVYVGDAASASVRALLADGVTPASGRVVQFSGSGVAGTLNGCGSPCTVITDGNGFAGVSFTAAGAGVVSLVATETGTVSNTVNPGWTVTVKPDTMTPVSAPSGSGLVGDAMPVAFAVKVLAGDGTAAAERSVVFAVTAGQAGLAPCGAATCAVVTDAMGLAQVSVTPLAAGRVQVQATEETNVLTASFTAAAKPDGMTLVSSPGNSVRQGATAANALSVRVVLADGVTPVAGLAVMFGTAGRGAGAVQFGACGAAACSVVTGADGVASTTVMGTAAGTVQLVVTPAAASGAQALTLAFEVVANDDSVNALEAATYLAEGSALRTSFMVSATANGEAAVGQAVAWTGANGMVFAGMTATTDANGQASMGVTLGPLAGNAVATGTACAWSNACATFTLTGVALGNLQATVVSGGGQAASDDASLQPVALLVTDAGGHGVAAAEVTVYQTVTAWTGNCPAQGRCPAAPVLASKVTVAVTDANGNLLVQPLVVAGAATSTEMAFSVGTQGFCTAVVTSTP